MMYFQTAIATRVLGNFGSAHTQDFSKIKGPLTLQPNPDRSQIYVFMITFFKKIKATFSTILSLSFYKARIMIAFVTIVYNGV